MSYDNERGVARCMAFSFVNAEDVIRRIVYFSAEQLAVDKSDVPDGKAVKITIEYCPSDELQEGVEYREVYRHKGGAE